nr:MAG TPA: hypothetical protein [Caudoviricetes sp.]
MYMKGYNYYEKTTNSKKSINDILRNILCIWFIN